MKKVRLRKVCIVCCHLYKKGIHMHIYVHTHTHRYICLFLKNEVWTIKLKESDYSMAEERDKVKGISLNILFYRFQELFIYMRPKMEQFKNQQG